MDCVSDCELCASSSTAPVEVDLNSSHANHGCDWIGDRACIDFWHTNESEATDHFRSQRGALSDIFSWLPLVYKRTAKSDFFLVLSNLWRDTVRLLLLRREFHRDFVALVYLEASSES
jgi:hypothetical protein